jgi:methylase of polypeptide subunit release factors
VRVADAARHLWSPTIPFVRRPTARDERLRPLMDRADRLARFVPPFTFTTVFAPEDTLLCLLAGDLALHLTGSSPAIVELTAGSGLVGLALLEEHAGATLYGVDIDPDAVPVAESNAELLGLGDRARFAEMSLWDEAIPMMLAEEGVGLLVCSPPYIPEPPDALLPIEAGSGPDGTAHIDHVLALADEARPAVLVLSWCSLSDPMGVVARAAALGFRLETLLVCLIADGEYSGMVRAYLRTLPTAFLNESADTLAALASDGSARFGFLLLAGVFRRGDDGNGGGEPVGADTGDAEPGQYALDTVAAVEGLMRAFVRDGLPALTRIDAPFDTEAYILDRWDEVALRAALHGESG